PRRPYIIAAVIGRHRDGGAPGGSESTLPLDVDPSGLALVVVGPGVEIEVALRGRAVWTIGRESDNDIVVHSPPVSRHHARLHGGEGFALEALASTNPLRFGGRKLEPGERVAIAPGETFTIGALIGVIRPVSELRTSSPVPGGSGDPRTTSSPPPRALREVL